MARFFFSNEFCNIKIQRKTWNENKAVEKGSWSFQIVHLLLCTLNKTAETFWVKKPLSIWVRFWKRTWSIFKLMPWFSPFSCLEAMRYHIRTAANNSGTNLILNCKIAPWWTSATVSFVCLCRLRSGTDLAADRLAPLSETYLEPLPHTSLSLLLLDNQIQSTARNMWKVSPNFT